MAKLIVLLMVFILFVSYVNMLVARNRRRRLDSDLREILDDE